MPLTDHPIALIVGANRGIGLGVVKAFLARGWDIIATARRPAEAHELAALAETHPNRVTIKPLDMNDPAQLDGFAGSLGGRKLDAVLVNAGVSGPAHRTASQATEAETGALMFTNAVAPIRLARHLLGHIHPGTGVLAFTSSVMGSVALNSGGHELYRASKAALNSLTRGLLVRDGRPQADPADAASRLGAHRHGRCKRGGERGGQREGAGRGDHRAARPPPPCVPRLHREGNRLVAARPAHSPARVSAADSRLTAAAAYCQAGQR